MIKQQIKALKIKFAVSHSLMAFVLLLLTILLFSYYSYVNKRNLAKQQLMNAVYNVEEAFIFNDLEDVSHFEDDIWAAVIDKSNRIVYGAVPKGINIKQGNNFTNKDGFMIFSSNLKDGVYRVVGFYNLKGLSSFYIKKAFFYIVLGFIFSILYGYTVYIFGSLWTKDIEKAYNELEEFTEFFSHEVLTPISSAIFYIEDEKIKDSLIKSKEFLHSFLNYQKKSVFPWKKSSVDIDALIYVIEKELLSLTMEKQLDIKKHITVRNSMINEEFLYFILKNPIENAVKYAKENSLITIDVYTKKKNLCFEIENSSDASRLPKGKYISDTGYGLGIILTEKMLKNINGSMKFEILQDKIVVKIVIPI